MLKIIRDWICSSYVNKVNETNAKFAVLQREKNDFMRMYINKKLQYIEVTKSYEAVQKENERLKDLLGKNVELAKAANTLYVTEHAIDRYIERFKNGEDRNSIRKRIYNEVVKHLFSMDKLEDGKYEIGRNMLARVVNNTVVTVYSK